MDPEVELRILTGEAAMKFMDATDSDLIHAFDEVQVTVMNLCRKLQDRGLDEQHAIQITTSMAVGAALDA